MKTLDMPEKKIFYYDYYILILKIILNGMHSYEGKC